MSIKQMYKKARPFLSRLLGLFLLKVGFVKLQMEKSKSRNLITVLYFHNPSAELFSGCVRWLIDNKYVFISIQELYNILSNRVLPPVGAVCLTVDDGWRENLSNIIPVINNWRIPICFFISTSPVEDGVFWWSICSYAERKGFEKSISINKLKTISESDRMKWVTEIRKKIYLDRETMTKEEVVAISKNIYVTIGSHTVNHACINQCNDEELAYELRESKRLLSDWINKEVPYFSYPNGNFKGTEHKMLAESGYILALTTKEEYVTPNSHDTFYLPRFCINDGGSLEENICKMTGAWQALRKYVNIYND